MSRLVLASGSPRRKELLTLAGFKFEIHLPDVDESPLSKEPPQKMVMRLSDLKAHTVAKLIYGEFLILAADTTVVNKRGKNLGKPIDRAEAFRMLKGLQGTSHFVFTAYCLLKVKDGKVLKKKTRTVKTTVTFKKMSEKEINAYLDCGESMDKAGAYAAQGAGMMLVCKMNGSYTNVVGLPLSHVIDDLKVFGLNPNG